MRGNRLLEGGAEFAGPPGQGWVVGTTADCDGDGMYDVVWFSPLRMSVGLMHGTVPVVQGPEIAGPE